MWCNSIDLQQRVTSDNMCAKWCWRSEVPRWLPSSVGPPCAARPPWAMGRRGLPAVTEAFRCVWEKVLRRLAAVRHSLSTSGLSPWRRSDRSCTARSTGSGSRAARYPSVSRPSEPLDTSAAWRGVFARAPGKARGFFRKASGTSGGHRSQTRPPGHECGSEWRHRSRASSNRHLRSEGEKNLG